MLTPWNLFFEKDAHDSVSYIAKLADEDLQHKKKRFPDHQRDLDIGFNSFSILKEKKWNYLKH